jgi:hypothetical protein
MWCLISAMASKRFQSKVTPNRLKRFLMSSSPTVFFPTASIEMPPEPSGCGSKLSLLFLHFNRAGRHQSVSFGRYPWMVFG